MLFVAAVVWALALWGALALLYSTIPRPDSCAAKTEAAAISQRAAQICSTELVGCSLTFEQIKQTIAEQEAAKGCQ